MSEPDPTGDPRDPAATRASAHLPGLDIEIVHRRSPTGDAEQIAINLTAVPSFAAFGRHLEGLNPVAFWAQAAQMMWAPMWGPWLAVASAMMGQPSLPRPLRRVSGRTHPIAPEQEPR